MEHLKYLLLIAFLFSVVSCKQAEAVPYEGIDFLFNESQPIQHSELNSFPKMFIGDYINQDSTYLIIEDKIIYYKWLNKNYLSFSDFKHLKDSLKIDKNKIYFDDKFVEYRKLKDSIEITDISYDTLFSVSSLNKAKKLKKSIVLNFKDSVYWKIKILTLNKNTINMMSFYSEEDLRRLDSIAVSKTQKIDSTRNIIHLSKSEFKKMLNLKRLGYVTQFKKLN